METYIIEIWINGQYRKHYTLTGNQYDCIKEAKRRYETGIYTSPYDGKVYRLEGDEKSYVGRF